MKNEEEKAAGGGAIHPVFHYLESGKSSGGLKGTDGCRNRFIAVVFFKQHWQTVSHIRFQDS